MGHDNAVRESASVESLAPPKTQQPPPAENENSGGETKEAELDKDNLKNQLTMTIASLRIAREDLQKEKRRCVFLMSRCELMSTRTVSCFPGLSLQLSSITANVYPAASTLTSAKRFSDLPSTPY